MKAVVEAVCGEAVTVISSLIAETKESFCSRVEGEATALKASVALGSDLSGLQVTKLTTNATTYLLRQAEIRKGESFPIETYGVCGELWA